MRILLTGASGYIGGRLGPRLLAAGHELRCLVRDRRRLPVRPWLERCEIVEGDVLEPATLPPALAGTDASYYLIHSMTASERSFEDRDRRGAEAFGEAARAAGVGHLLYLGGLGDAERGMSRHLRSRQETGRALAAAGVPTTEFRAAIIVGSGSISFEMIRYLTERLPVMITPRWVETRVQPIAVRDVLAYLVEGLEHPPEGHRIVEIGGPDVLTYRELMLGYARARGLRRRLIPVPVLSPRLSSYWVNLVTPIPAAIARPLVEGLASEVVVRDPEPARRFGVRPLPYAEAVDLALDRMRQGSVETLWSESAWAAPGHPSPPDRVEDREGLLVDRRSVRVAAPIEAAYRAVAGIGGDRGWYAFDRLWELRGALDRLAGGIGMRRGRRDPERLLPGDALDFWRVEIAEPPRSLQLAAEMRLPGRAWLRFDLRELEGGSEIRQTALFEPRGLVGLLYWWTVFPLHALVFPGMLRAIRDRAEGRGPDAAA